jgi:hypothetical protein
MVEVFMVVAVVLIVAPDGGLFELVEGVSCGILVFTVTAFLLGSFWPSSDNCGEEGGGGTTGISNLTLLPRDGGGTRSSVSFIVPVS